MELGICNTGLFFDGKVGLTGSRWLDRAVPRFGSPKVSCDNSLERDVKAQVTPIEVTEAGPGALGPQGSSEAARTSSKSF